MGTPTLIPSQKSAGHFFLDIMIVGGHCSQGVEDAEDSRLQVSFFSSSLLLRKSRCEATKCFVRRLTPGTRELNIE